MKTEKLNMIILLNLEQTFLLTMFQALEIQTDLTGNSPEKGAVTTPHHRWPR